MVLGALGVLLRRSGDQNRHRQALQRAVRHDQQMVNTSQKRLGRADQLLIERIGVRRRERREFGVSLRVEARAQGRYLIGQRLRPHRDTVKGNIVVAQHPKPARVIGDQIDEQRLIAGDQEPSAFSQIARARLLNSSASA